jgi:O-antigen ligase
MARTRRARRDKTFAHESADGVGVAAPATVTAPDARGLAARQPLPPEVEGAGTVAILALIMLLAPALGVPHEEMLQDTLKSIVVAFGALGAGLLFFWRARQCTALRWHAVIVLPLLLMAYALGSMVWSHTFLAGVEAIRWFLFALLLWLSLNTLSRERLPLLAWGVHVGAVVASLWAVLQFWFDFSLFPQGPNPASTFVNRNFFAEFAVCTLPFSALLIARARQSALAVLLAASAGLVILAILMTGTRSALSAMWLQGLVLLPLMAWLYRRQLAFRDWGRATAPAVIGVLFTMVLGLGLIPTGNAKIAAEEQGHTALERGFKRTASISPGDPSLGVRIVMWRATGRMIQRHPLAGVGAGAWENDEPLYQDAGAQLETDYYVHNEILQLLAEYGLAGWVFLLGLVAYLIAATWDTLTRRVAGAQAEAPWRAVFLCSLLSLLIVSNVGFPWRMASTGALFALCLGGLAASDARMGWSVPWSALRLPWSRAASQVAAVLSIACLALAMFITRQAADAEYKIVHATRIALSISQSGNPNDPRWNPSKAEMLKLVREGIAINPHYRKITPMVADELARWGDWKNATWIWESVLGSRPNVVAILTNVARGYAIMGDLDKAGMYLDRAEQIQPRAPSVRSLEVILLQRTGQDARALALARLPEDAGSQLRAAAASAGIPCPGRLCGPTGTWKRGPRRASDVGQQGVGWWLDFQPGPLGGAQGKAAFLRGGDLHGDDRVPAAAGSPRSLRHQAAGLLWIGLMEDLLARLHRRIGMREIGPALEGAAKLAARNHFLARIATLLEIDAAHRLVVEHLRYEGLDNGRGDGGDSAADLAPQPKLRGQRRSGRRGSAGWRDPEAARLAVGRIKTDDVGIARTHVGPGRGSPGHEWRDRIARNSVPIEVGRCVAQPDLGPQHEHRDPFERGGQDVAAHHQQDFGAAALETNEAGLHPAFRGAIRGKPRLAGAKQREVLRQLALQEMGGVFTVDAKDPQMGQGRYTVQDLAHGYFSLDTKAGVAGSGRDFGMPRGGCVVMP